MDILLVPGLWLDASSWDRVIPVLDQPGRRVHALTMPGLGLPAAESADIGIDDWVAAVVAEIDAIGPTEEGIVLVGHSGGGNVVWGAADARPDRVDRVIFVDTVPPPNGAGISEFDAVDGVIPFPGWDFFPEEDVFDVDAETRARTLPLTQSVPERVPTDPITLTHSDRHQIPVTLLMGGMDQAELESGLSEWGSFGEEYQAIEDAEVVKIGSGHWPQFSQPQRLGELIAAALG